MRKNTVGGLALAAASVTLLAGCGYVGDDLLAQIEAKDGMAIRLDEVVTDVEWSEFFVICPYSGNKEQINEQLGFEWSGSYDTHVSDSSMTVVFIEGDTVVESESISLSDVDMCGIVWERQSASIELVLHQEADGRWALTLGDKE